MANGEELRSIIEQAAVLPPEAPHILSVDQSVAPPDDPEVCAVIDVGEFEDALRDPRLLAFCKEAIAYREKLSEEGRIVDHQDLLDS